MMTLAASKWLSPTQKDCKGRKKRGCTTREDWSRKAAWYTRAPCGCAPRRRTRRCRSCSSGSSPLLATLQYRWLGKVSEAEREQMQRSLTQRAREFAEDFDGEMSGVYRAHQVTREAVGAKSAFDGDVEHWRATASFPRMVRAVYLAERVGREAHAARSTHLGDLRRTAAGVWPRDLGAGPRTAPHRRPPRVRPATGNTARFISISLMPVAPEVPALVIPVDLPPGPPPAAADRKSIWMRWPIAHTSSWTSTPRT